MITSVFVTGGSGFVGRLIVKAIQEQHPDWQVTVFDLERPGETIKEINFIRGDVTDLASIEHALASSNPSVVIHTAGLVPPLSERFGRRLQSKVLSVNVDGTRNMLSVSKEHGVSAFVWTGSCTAVIEDTRYSYRNVNEKYPTSTTSLIYGESKAMAEKLVLDSNTDGFATCALRPSTLFGPGDHQLVPSIHACIAKWETPFILGDAENLWDASYAPNVADAHVLAVENLLSSRSAAGEAIFIQNNEPVTFRDFCLEVWKNFGHYPPFEVRLPYGLAWFAGLCAEGFTWVTGGTYTLSRGSVNDACAIRYANGDKARALLGFEPRVGIEEGIRISCAEYKTRLETESRDQELKGEKRPK